MKTRDNIAAIGELAASEDGVFTSGQAARVGIPRYALSQAERSGFVERIAHGAYRLATSLDDGLDSLRAAYKLTSPHTYTYERMGEGYDGVAACGATAAYVLGIGELRPTPWEIATPARFNSRRKGVRYRVMPLPKEQVLWERGVPVTRPERTICDLMDADADLSLVADALIDAVGKFGSGPFSIDTLEELLGTARFRMLCSAAGLDEGGPSELVRLDEIGHVAIRKVGTHGSI